MPFFRRSLSILLGGAALVRAEVSPDPVVRMEPVVVEAPALTESPATVTPIDLATLPLGEATTSTLAAHAANFFIATNDALSFNDIFALRGLTNTPIFGDPAVSFYLDDLPLGSGFTVPADLTGFARAELHRGPTQNTVFGRAGSAGVVTLSTPLPSAVAAGDLRADIGDYRSRQVAASFATAAGSPADAYVCANYAARDGYIMNSVLGRDVDYQESASALARLRLRPNAVTELTLLVTALRAHDGAQPLVPLGGPYFTVARTQEGLTDLDAWNAALTAAVATSAGRLTATTSASRWNLDPYADTLAFGPAELTSKVAQKQDTWNEEIKLAANPTDPVRWLTGLFYSDGQTSGRFDRLFGPFPYEQAAFTIDGRDLAGFGEATLALSTTVSITAGLRLEQSRKQMNRIETVPAPQTFDLRTESSAVLPKLGMSFAPDRAVVIFATAGAGYKPGGFSAFTGEPTLAAFAPERTRTLEAGVTWTGPAKNVAATIRGFYYAITGYQIERSFATGGTGNEYLVVNAGRARSAGAELELSWRPRPELAIAADVGYTDVRLRSFTDPFTGVSYAGKRAPAVPEYDVSLRVDYESPCGLFVGADLMSNGRTYYTESEDPDFGQMAYALLGAKVGYLRGRYRLTLHGENLANARYYSAITPGTGHGTPGAPRTVGVEFRVGF